MLKTYDKKKLLDISKDLDALSAKWAFKGLVWLALTGAAIGIGVSNIVDASVQYGAFRGKREALQVIANDIEEENGENS